MASRELIERQGGAWRYWCPDDKGKFSKLVDVGGTLSAAPARGDRGDRRTR